MPDAEDIEAVATLYAAARLEDLGILAICDRLLELYLRGGLPIAAGGEGAALLDAYWLGREERLGTDERRALYARALGPGFDHLLGRLAAAITDYDARTRADDIAWAADELRSSIDAHLDEHARDAVALMHGQLGAALGILGDPEILAAYGARDTWQLVDQLARLELGHPGAVRPQALAAAGSVLLGWLAGDGSPPGEEVADAAEAWLTAAATPPEEG